MRDAGAAGAHEMSWTFPFSRVCRRRRHLLGTIQTIFPSPRSFSHSSLPPFSLPPLVSHVSLTRISASSLGEASSISAKLREREREEGEGDREKETETDRVGE